MTLVQIGRASSAATTTFTSVEIEGPGGLTLHLDGNQKICRENGTYEVPRPNALSLLAGNGVTGDEPGHERRHCPGSTATCREACYVHGLAKHAGSTYALYEHNSATLDRILAGAEARGYCDDFAEAWADHLGEWIVEHCSSFRWHVSGDVRSVAHADWISLVVARSCVVDHWIYTRSFDHLAPLVDVATFNGGPLALNLSCDQDNYTEAVRAVMRYGRAENPNDGLCPCETCADPAEPGPGWLGPRLCYLTRDGHVPADLPEGSVIFPDYSLRGAKDAGPAEQRDSSAWWQSLTGDQRRMVCPTDFYGKSEGNRCGPCARCLT